MPSVPWQAYFACCNSTPYISAYNSHCFNCFASIETSINTLTHTAVFFTFHMYSVINPTIHQAPASFFFASHRDDKAPKNSDEAEAEKLFGNLLSNFFDFFQTKIFWCFFFLSWWKSKNAALTISNFVTK